MPARLASLDQYRGYTVLGMFLVNFVGFYQATPAILRHHNTYCSYADTIMPQFFFAVGYAYRLTLLRRLATDGAWQTYWKFVRRSLGLILIGVVIYHLDGGAKNWADLKALGFVGFLKTAFQRSAVQTLVHIGLTTLWVMPVMAARSWALVAYACASGALHFGLSWGFYYEWVMRRPGIDGGLLGFMTWAIPLLAGALAYDMMQRRPRVSADNQEPAKDPRVSAAAPIVWRPLCGWGIALMVAGYGLSCLSLVTPPANMPIGPKVAPDSVQGSRIFVEPPFVPPSRPVNIWTMSQRAGSVSYLTFGAGLSMALFGLFVVLCDIGGVQFGFLRTLGSNALAGYIIHDLVMDAMRPYTPRDSPLWFVSATFLLFLAITYTFVRYLERNQIYLRL
jgi:predicted acyltransferase